MFKMLLHMGAKLLSFDFMYVRESTCVSMAPLLIIGYRPKVVVLRPEDVPSHVRIIPNLLGHSLRVL